MFKRVRGDAVCLVVENPEALKYGSVSWPSACRDPRACTKCSKTLKTMCWGRLRSTRAAQS